MTKEKLPKLERDLEQQNIETLMPREFLPQIVQKSHPIQMGMITHLKENIQSRISHDVMPKKGHFWGTSIYYELYTSPYERLIMNYLQS